MKQFSHVIFANKTEVSTPNRYRRAEDYLRAYGEGLIEYDEAAKGYCTLQGIYSEAKVIVANTMIPAYHHSFNCAINLKYS